MRRSINVDSKSAPISYKVEIEVGSREKIGQWACEYLGEDALRVALVSNTTVFPLYGVEVVRSLTRSGFRVSTFVAKDGERHKNLRTVGGVLHHLGENGLTRTDAVVALGGGVVGDIAGFAAATYQRGIRLLQVPTTVLAMVDSSVGGKTGVNSTFGKNTIGAFHQPRGVLIDPEVLATLPRREVTAGLCEMIKHAAIGSDRFLKRTGKVLESLNDAGIADAGFTDLIAENVRFKARIVANDERELASRTDSRSRKILNFGHTLAHALEKVTNYRYFKHGEAVGYGILFAAELSKTLALMSQKEVDLLNDVVHRAGALPSLAGIDEREVLEAFKSDKKNLSGSLQMVLLKGIGKPVIVSERDIPRSSLRKVLRQLLRGKV